MTQQKFAEEAETDLLNKKNLTKKSEHKLKESEHCKTKMSSVELKSLNHENSSQILK